MALINGYGQGPWGTAPYGDPTGFNATVETIASKNSSGSVSVSEANSATPGLSQSNSSSGIAIVTDGQ